jgi:hypothetical protein
MSLDKIAVGLKAAVIPLVELVAFQEELMPRPHDQDEIVRIGRVTLAVDGHGLLLATENARVRLDGGTTGGRPIRL